MFWKDVLLLWAHFHVTTFGTCVVQSTAILDCLFSWPQMCFRVKLRNVKHVFFAKGKREWLEPWLYLTNSSFYHMCIADVVNRNFASRHYRCHRLPCSNRTSRSVLHCSSSPYPAFQSDVVCLPLVVSVSPGKMQHIVFLGLARPFGTIVSIRTGSFCIRDDENMEQKIPDFRKKKAREDKINALLFLTPSRQKLFFFFF